MAAGNYDAPLRRFLRARKGKIDAALAMLQSESHKAACRAPLDKEPAAACSQARTSASWRALPQQHKGNTTSKRDATARPPRREPRVAARARRRRSAARAAGP